MIVDTALKAAELLAPHLATRAGRGVFVLHLDRDGRLLETSSAKADSAGLPVREIVTAAVRAGAAAMIVGFARGGDDAAPTEDDLAAGRRLADAGAAVGIRLTDLFVFAGADCRSFRELKLL